MNFLTLALEAEAFRFLTQNQFSLNFCVDKLAWEKVMVSMTCLVVECRKLERTDEPEDPLHHQLLLSSAHYLYRSKSSFAVLIRK